MRRGHRRRLTREAGRESCRGRVTYARSLNKGSRRLAGDRAASHRGQRKQAQWQQHDLDASLIEAACELDDGMEYDCDFRFHIHPWSRCTPEGSQDDALHYKSALACDALPAKAEEETEYDSVQSASDTIASDTWSLCSSGDRVPTAPHRRSAPAWEAAKKRADEVARAYLESPEKPERAHTTCRNKLPRQAARPVALRAPPLTAMPVRQPFSRQPIPREEQQGSPALRLELEHSSVLAAAKLATAGSKKWHSKGHVQVEVLEESAEYRAVEEYFLSTLDRCVEVVGLQRLQNADMFRRFAAGQGEDMTVMFHGCRGGASNEDSIIQNGFKVSCCTSGGQNFGTWFAYNASYSDRGYVFTDKQGVSHIFVCLVARRHVMIDDMTMRVVAQDCAYPLWLLRYEKGGARRRDGRFFVVKDGLWVLEDQS